MPLTPSSPLSYSTTSLPDLRVILAGQQRPCVKSENMEIDSKSLASEISLECLEGKMKRSLKTMEIWGILKRLTLHLEYCRPQLSYTTWFPTILGLISLQKSFFGVRFNALIECTERFEACCIGLRSLPMQKSICSLRTKFPKGASSSALAIVNAPSPNHCTTVKSWCQLCQIFTPALRNRLEAFLKFNLLLHHVSWHEKMKMHTKETWWERFYSSPLIITWWGSQTLKQVQQIEQIYLQTVCENFSNN